MFVAAGGAGAVDEAAGPFAAEFAVAGRAGFDVLALRGDGGVKHGLRVVVGAVDDVADVAHPCDSLIFPAMPLEIPANPSARMLMPRPLQIRVRGVQASK